MFDINFSLIGKSVWESLEWSRLSSIIYCYGEGFICFPGFRLSNVSSSNISSGDCHWKSNSLFCCGKLYLFTKCSLNVREDLRFNYRHACQASLSTFGLLEVLCRLGSSVLGSDSDEHYWCYNRSCSNSVLIQF